jgi:hypothetical protein
MYYWQPHGHSGVRAQLMFKQALFSSQVGVLQHYNNPETPCAQHPMGVPHATPCRVQTSCCKAFGKAQTLLNSSLTYNPVAFHPTDIHEHDAQTHD